MLCPQPEAGATASASPERPSGVSSLTASNLEQVPSFCNDDPTLAQLLVKAEGYQMFRQALHKQLQDNPQELRDYERVQSAQTLGEQLAQIQALLGPTVSSSTLPIQRHLTMSPFNDPYNPLARRALSDAGIAYGSLETVQTRTDTAAVLAAGDGDDDDDEDCAPRTDRAYTVPINKKTGARISRAIRLSKTQKKDNVDDAEDSGPAKRRRPM